MNTKEAEVLDYILHNMDQTLTTDRIAAHLNMDTAEIQAILEELEDQTLITVGDETPDGHYYSIRPTMQAQQEFAADTGVDMDIGPSVDPLQKHRRSTPEA